MDNLKELLENNHGLIFEIEETEVCINSRIKGFNAEGKYFTLKELQKGVDGLIEIAETVTIYNQNYLVIVNEEGLIRNLPFNERFAMNFRNKHRNIYAGNVLLIPEKMIK